MARADVRAALEKLRGGIGFGEYVNTLEREKASVISTLLAKITPREQWPDLIAEARVYDELLSDINKHAR